MDMDRKSRHERIRELYTADVPRKEICSELGITDHQLTGICSQQGLSRPEKPKTWDQCRITLLIKLVAERLTAGQIGKILQVTRNAVIGRCRRQGLQLRNPANCSPEGRAAIEARRAAKRLKAQRAAQEKAEVEAQRLAELPRYEPPPPPPPTYTAVQFIDARPDQCRFPLWPPTVKTGLVCGAKIHPGTSWCPDCFRRVSVRRP